ncbi:hypothetical protein CDD83_5523 [Cordyceps sp. RAO-2017]|nr:hypothetical protein CDD83_5523 [Cordyceps sp. RAO-2017]
MTDDGRWALPAGPSLTSEPCLKGPAVLSRLIAVRLVLPAPDPDIDPNGHDGGARLLRRRLPVACEGEGVRVAACVLLEPAAAAACLALVYVWITPYMCCVSVSCPVPVPAYARYLTCAARRGTNPSLARCPAGRDASCLTSGPPGGCRHEPLDGDAVDTPLGPSAHPPIHLARALARTFLAGSDRAPFRLSVPLRLSPPPSAGPSAACRPLAHRNLPRSSLRPGYVRAWLPDRRAERCRHGSRAPNVDTTQPHALIAWAPTRPRPSVRRRRRRPSSTRRPPTLTTRATARGSGRGKSPELFQTTPRVAPRARFAPRQSLSDSTLINEDKVLSKVGQQTHDIPPAAQTCSEGCLFVRPLGPPATPSSTDAHRRDGKHHFRLLCPLSADGPAWARDRDPGYSDAIRISHVEVESASDASTP